MAVINKVIYINAFFKPLFEDVTKQIPTGEKSKGFFGGVKEVMRNETQLEQTGWSDSEVDGKRLSDDIANAIESLNQEGYEVVAVMPVTSGNYFYKYEAEGITSSVRYFSETEKVSGGASYGFGYGYSYTEGVSIIAKKIS